VKLPRQIICFPIDSGEGNVGGRVEIVGQVQKHMAEGSTESTPAGVYQNHHILKTDNTSAQPACGAIRCILHLLLHIKRYGVRSPLRPKQIKAFFFLCGTISCISYCAS
jgi:hypothetical protein